LLADIVVALKSSLILDQINTDLNLEEIFNFEVLIQEEEMYVNVIKIKIHIKISKRVVALIKSS